MGGGDEDGHVGLLRDTRQTTVGALTGARHCEEGGDPAPTRARYTLTGALGAGAAKGSTGSGAALGVFIFRWVYMIMPASASTMPRTLYRLKSPPKIKKLCPAEPSGMVRGGDTG
jgi:hypothetical protein